MHKSIRQERKRRERKNIQNKCEIVLPKALECVARNIFRIANSQKHFFLVRDLQNIEKNLLETSDFVHCKNEWKTSVRASGAEKGKMATTNCGASCAMLERAHIYVEGFFSSFFPLL